MATELINHTLTIDNFKQYNQWVCASNPDKAPINPKTGRNAMPNNASTWSSYERAYKRWQSETERLLGIGFMLIKDQKITCVDLDKCIDEDGKLKEWARKIVETLNSYTEYSPSGRGLHIWVQGSIPKNIPQDTPGIQIEMYNQNHYMTITGNHFEGTPNTIEPRNNEVRVLYTNVCEAREQAKEAEKEAKRREKKQGKTERHSEIKGTEKDTRYGLKALQEECADLASTQEGGRWEHLRVSAFRIGQLVGGGELTYDTAKKAIEDAAYQCGLTDKDIDKTLEPCLDAGIDEPRSAPKTTQHFNCTDLGNAERFAARYRGKVGWCSTWNCWMVFNGKCWEKDQKGRVDQYGKVTVRAIYKEASAEEDENIRAKLAKHAIASESNRAVKAMLDRAKSELPVQSEEFNTHLHLLNCNNGTLDLRNGELRPHNPEDMITCCLHVNYNPLALAPTWIKFVYRIFDNNQELIDFVHTSLGMTLSGDTREQCWYLLHGEGNNGKSVLLETPRKILEDYGFAARMESFLVSRDEKHYDHADFYGKRMITASEIQRGQQLSEAFMKKLVSGRTETITAERKYENSFSFYPECTVWLSVNHKPVVKDNSKGMWRRVRYIPFNVIIPPEEVDTELPAKLLQEAEGILAWMVVGCMTWYRMGKQIVPDIVVEATNQYRKEQDTTTRFFEDECIFKPTSKTFTASLNQRYEMWCTQHSEKTDYSGLKEALNKLGLHSKRGTGGKYCYEGIELKPMNTPPDTSSEGNKVQSEGTSEGQNLKSEGSENNLERKSEPSEGSEVKSPKSYARENDKKSLGEVTSLPSLPSLSEHKTEKTTFTQVIEEARKSEGTPRLEVARQFVTNLNTLEGYSLRIETDGTPIIKVPDNTPTSDEEFSAIDEQVTVMWNELVQILVYNL